MTPDSRIFRESLLAQVRRRGGARNEIVAEALRTVPRHLFVPDVSLESAYRDEAIVTKRDPHGVPLSSSSQPTIMALMLDQLGVAPGQRVLEIGAGTGYNAALIAHAVGPQGRVVTIDIDRDLVELAQRRLAEAGYPGVTVVCADGANGFAEEAPYDRVIATAGVWDLAPAWLEQVAPAGRMVVPLDLRGVYCSIAFEWANGYWTSRSVVPCGFLGLRGAFAGPRHTQVLDRESELSLALPDSREIDGNAVRAALAGPVAEHPTGVVVSTAPMFAGLGLWLAVSEPRCCTLSEEDSPTAARLTSAPLCVAGAKIAPGILAGDSLAILGRRSDADMPCELSALGYGPDGQQLAAALAALVHAWDGAGRPGTDGLRLDAYARSTPDDDLPGRVIIDKVHTRLVLSWSGGTSP